MGRPIIDITGERLGRLVAIQEDYKIGKASYWKCRCDCGNIVTIRKSCFLAGQTKSCGCLRKERTAERNRAGKMGPSTWKNRPCGK